ncbi:MAG: hypothetical protein DBY18_03945 [Clostridia bacterium]|nr:MAG: hypothetical protein DBY18_03945 [Clostridia bacterium]
MGFGEFAEAGRPQAKPPGGRFRRAEPAGPGEAGAACGWGLRRAADCGGTGGSGEGGGMGGGLRRGRRPQAKPPGGRFRRAKPAGPGEAGAACGRGLRRAADRGGTGGIGGGGGDG